MYHNSLSTQELPSLFETEWGGFDLNNYPEVNENPVSCYCPITLMTTHTEVGGGGVNWKIYGEEKVKINFDWVVCLLTNKNVG